MKFKAKKGKVIHFEPNPIKFIDEIYETVNEKEIEILKKALDVEIMENNPKYAFQNNIKLNEPTKAQIKEELQKFGYVEDKDYPKNANREALLQALETAKTAGGEKK